MSYIYNTLQLTFYEHIGWKAATFMSTGSRVQGPVCILIAFHLHSLQTNGEEKSCTLLHRCPPVWWFSSWTQQCTWGSNARTPTAQGSTDPERYTARNMRNALQKNKRNHDEWDIIICFWAAVCCIWLNYKSLPKNSLLPGLELFGTEWVCDILNRVTQAVGVVIGGVDTPIEKDEKHMTHWKTWQHVKW